MRTQRKIQGLGRMVFDKPVTFLDGSVMRLMITPSDVPHIRVLDERGETMATGMFVPLGRDDYERDGAGRADLRATKQVEPTPRLILPTD
jgi:hypothetical protein